MRSGGPRRTDDAARLDARIRNSVFRPAPSRDHGVHGIVPPGATTNARPRAMLGAVGTVDQTMPALFAAPGAAGEVFTPLAQLGAGPDGTVVLARRGDQLVELHQLSFAADGPRWAALEARVRAIGAVGHAAVRAVLALERAPATAVLEGDSFPPLAELIEQPAVDLARALGLLHELSRALAAAHRVGVFHGGIHPWSVWVGPADRPRFELTRLATRPAHHAWAARCRAPEAADAPGDLDHQLDRIDGAVDVYAIGRLLELFATEAGRAADPALTAIVQGATAHDPDARPAMAELVDRLHRRLHPAGSGVPAKREASAPGPAGEVRVGRPAVGTAIGRYELVRQLGAGAMGEVWEARDTTGGANVAVKLLRPEIAASEELLRRFRKEARVLGKVGSPYIANLIDLNEDRGTHYLVLELVAGGSVGAACKRAGKLPERLALGIIADACRGLAEPHRLGIVHRDLKPDNMMFVRPGIELERAPIGPLVKLGDFGIARAAEAQGPEGATREGTVLGTPEYMAPEQCQGGAVTPATDVYALGCCLFALLAGRPPFVAEGDNQMAVILQQLREVPPRLDALVPEVTPVVADLVARCLAKDPAARPADAAELLAVVDRMCQGATALITAHPTPPIYRAARVQTYAFSWDLAAPPDALWPFVSNTEKMNRATGLAAVRFETETLGDGGGAPATTGHQRVAGLALRWREHPYEWIEGSRHVVLRVFDRGVLRWYVAEVQLERLAGRGTRLRNTIKLEPRSLLARVLSRWEIGVRYRRRLDRVYRRLDRMLAAGAARPEIDPIDPEIAIPAAGRARVQAAAAQLISAGLAPRAVESLAAYLTSASDQDVARIRPLELAARFAVPEDAMIEACLRATRLGLVGMVWDVICPSCRIPSSMTESLAKIEEHARCKACNVSFSVDFSRAIELAFRASPDVRPVETQTFCIGGPAHFPHIAAQVRLAPGERFALPLALGPGFYLVRSPQLPRVHELRVTAQGGVRRLDVMLGERADLAILTAGDQLLTIENPEPREVVVRVERAGDRAFALTAARVMATAAFRELFPDQQLAPGRLMAVTQATLVVAQVDDAQALFRALGDSKAFPVATRFFEEVGALAREYGGSLVKTFGGLAIAAFERPGPAVEAALALQAAVDTQPMTAGLTCRIAVHRGPMMALTQSGRLDYFGQNVELALSVAAATPPAVVALTQTVCQDAGVAERLQATPDQLGLVPLAGGTWVVHVRAPRGTAPDARASAPRHDRP
jgi:serine/threonine protein kinase/class 3 adenylate cyclase